eukprot:365596-Chlamydomonas_euryale.AAC.10
MAQPPQRSQVLYPCDTQLERKLSHRLLRRLSRRFHVVTKRLLVQGFIVGDLIKEYGESFEADMRRYLTEKKVTVEVDIRHGLEQAGTAFCDMMRGANAGKMLVAV